MHINVGNESADEFILGAHRYRPEMRLADFSPFLNHSNGRRCGEHVLEALRSSDSRVDRLRSIANVRQDDVVKLNALEDPISIAESDPPNIRMSNH